MAALQAEAIGFSFGPIHVVDDLSLTVTAGEVVGLVGPNGCGKTTVLKLLSGLLSPGSGSVRYGDRELASFSARERAEARSYVAQSVPQGWPYDVEEMVSMGMAYRRRFFGLPKLADEVRSLLDELELEVSLSRRFNQLSGGERQQVLVARALLQRSRCMMLDEPLSQLDPRHRLAVLRALRARARKGVAVLLSIHDLNLAALACDRLVMLARGKVFVSGQPAQVLTSGNIERIYRVQACCGRHPRLDVPTVTLDPGTW